MFRSVSPCPSMCMLSAAEQLPRVVVQVCFTSAMLAGLWLSCSLPPFLLRGKLAILVRLHCLLLVALHLSTCFYVCQPFGFSLPPAGCAECLILNNEVM